MLQLQPLKKQTHTHTQKKIAMVSITELTAHVHNLLLAEMWAKDSAVPVSASTPVRSECWQHLPWAWC